MDGEKAGFIMLADPEVGVRYYQEFRRDVAEDQAKVISLDETVTLTVNGKKVTYENVDSSSTIHLREHGLVQEQQHVYRRRPGHPPVSRLLDRAARRRHLVAPHAAVLGDVARLRLPERLHLNLLLAEACDCLVLCLHRAIPDRPASVPWAFCSMSYYGSEHRGRLIACLPSERSGSS